MLLDKRVDILRLTKETGPPPTWEWTKVKSSWSSPAIQQRKNLIAKTGTGTKTVVFTLSKQRFDRDQAILYQGLYHLPTDIDQSDPTVTIVTTAQVKIIQCRVSRNTGQLDDLNRPTNEMACVAVFPASMVEKWTGYAQEFPQQVNRATLVLLTSKEIMLQPNDLVKMEGMEKPGVVRLCHLLDECRNEYEVSIEQEW